MFSFQLSCARRQTRRVHMSHPLCHPAFSLCLLSGGKACGLSYSELSSFFSENWGSLCVLSHVALRALALFWV